MCVFAFMHASMRLIVRLSLVLYVCVCVSVCVCVCVFVCLRRVCVCVHVIEYVLQGCPPLAKRKMIKIAFFKNIFAIINASVF